MIYIYIYIHSTTNTRLSHAKMCHTLLMVPANYSFSLCFWTLNLLLTVLTFSIEISNSLISKRARWIPVLLPWHRFSCLAPIRLHNPSNASFLVWYKLPISMQLNHKVCRETGICHDISVPMQVESAQICLSRVEGSAWFVLKK